MHLLLNILFWVAAAGTTTSTIYCLMVIAAAVRFGLRKRREAREDGFLPAVSLLKPLHGTEAGLERNLETFFEQEYPEFELLFCARHESDEGLKLARRVGERYPQVKAQYVTCGEPQPRYHNAKVFSLERLAQAAKHDLFLTSDADVRVRPDYVRRMVQNLKDPKMSLASCVYLGTTAGGFFSQLDAVGKSVEMTSGVLVADMLEGTKFALGATMMVRRQAFEDVGGFFELAEFYADDFVLGNRLANQGKGVKMATYIIRLMVPPVPFWTSFRNQLRWMQSTRRSRPWGHLGSGLTFAVPFGVLGLVWGLATGHPGLGLLWLLGTVANRWVQAFAILRALGDPDWLWSALIYPFRDLMGGALWVGSYGGDRFYYRGKIYKLRESGRVEAPPE